MPLHAELQPLDRVEQMEIDGNLDILARGGEIARPDVAQTKTQSPPLIGHIQTGDRLIRQHIVVVVVVRFTHTQPEERAIGGVVRNAGRVRAVPPARGMVVGSCLPRARALGVVIIHIFARRAVEVFALPGPTVAETDR